MTTTTTSRIFRCTAARVGTIDPDFVIFSGIDRRLHVLNQTARAVWERIGDGSSGQQMCRELADEYGVEPDEVRPDVLGLLDQLVDRGICHLDHGCDHDEELADAARSEQSSADPDQIGVSAEPQESIRALGVPILVETDDALLRTELVRVLDPLRAEIDLSDPTDLRRLQHIVVNGAGNLWHVRRNGNSVITVSSRERAIRTVVAECNSAPLLHVDGAVVFHSAVADLGRGNVLFPGVSNSGKSTLVAQLTARGHEYGTDEAAAVDIESLAVSPFTKSICLAKAALQLLPDLASSPKATRSHSALDIDPRTLGPGRLGRGGPVIAVVFPTFDADSAPVLRPLTQLDALRRLIANTFAFDHVGASAFGALIRMVTVLPFYELSHAGGTAHLEQLEVLFGDGNSISL